MTAITVNGYQVTVDDTFLKLSPADQKETVAEIAKTIAAREAQFSDLMKGTAFRLHGVDPTAIAKAYEAGYSDDEIVAHLSAKAPEQFKQAKLAGFTSKEILRFLSADTAQASDTKEAHQVTQAVQVILAGFDLR
jgi:hypothetical protein